MGLALLLRLVAFAVTENKQSDAPMRALIAERMNLEPRAALNPRTYCQWGPLHTALMRPFLALDPDAPRSSRYLSLLAGMATFLPLFAFARRLTGENQARLAVLALAVSPPHIQASTTAASEALYLLLMLGSLERLLAALASRRLATYALSGALASLAAVTRYDAWLAIPVTAVAALVLARPRARLAGLVLYGAAAAVLPMVWLVWGKVVTGDAIFFAHYISADHANLARAVNERLGPVLARLRQLSIWTVSFAAAMTPALLVAFVWGARRVRSWSWSWKLVAVSALTPPAAYLAQGLLFLTFEPLCRFALVPGALLLPLAAAALPEEALRARRRIALAVVATSALIAAIVMVLAWRTPGHTWDGAESLGPVIRLERDDRAVAAFLRAHRAADERVFIDTRGFADATLTHASRAPHAQSVSLSETRDPGRSFADAARVLRRGWLAVHDEGWGARLGPTLPPDALRFGAWRLVHVR